MWNAGLDEAQAGIKIAGRNINNLRYANFIPLYFFSIFQFFFLPQWLSNFSTHLNKLVGLLKSRFLKPSMMALVMGTKGSWNLAITKDKNKFLSYS